MEFCKGISALIINKICGFTAISGNIIEKNLTKFGGKAEFYSNTSDLSKYTHLIVPSAISKEKLKSIFKCSIEDIPIPIITENWAHELFISKCYIDPKRYLWKEISEPKTKREVPKSPSPSKRIKVDMLENSNRNLNFHLTNELEKLKNYYEIIIDKGRSIQYGNIIRTLRLLPFKVEKIEQVKDLEGFGDKTLNKIKEILDKGGLARLKTFSLNERLTTMKSLTEIHGIGNDFAYKLYQQGVKTQSQLIQFSQDHPESFTRTQLISIQLHSDFQIKIPRAEVKEIADSIISTLKTIDNSAKYEICGSYRRQREYCGDVDIVIGTSTGQLLPLLVESCPIVTHTFSLSVQKFIGVFKLHDYHRRVDIYCCKPEEYWFAILYFTGSSNYNRMLRLSAGKNNLHLSNTSLFDLRTNQSVISPEHEDDIIKFLGFPILSLKDRDI